jgi:ribosomal protein S18 acetylase RimI-like enzyme
MNIRPVQPADRNRLFDILLATKRFTDQEVGWAIDLVDKAIADPGRGEYVVQVLEDAGAVEGYVCYGPTPMTDSVFDLYWIAVDPRRQGQGLGQRLLGFVENEVTRLGGRMLLIETSSKESYAPTLRFYERSGYDEISRIKDFYRVEHDKIVYSKKLTQ